MKKYTFIKEIDIKRRDKRKCSFCNLETEYYYNLDSYSLSNGFREASIGDITFCIDCMEFFYSDIGDDMKNRINKGLAVKNINNPVSKFKS